MVDPRIKKLADILVNYSITAKKGDMIALNFAVEGKPLALECYKLLLKKGVYVKVNPGVNGFGYQYYKLSTPEMLKRFPKLAMAETKLTDGEINIGAPMNTREFTNIDPKKVAIRQKVVRPISDFRLKKDNWVICEYPTNALAQDAEMSFEEFEDFAYGATNQDWKKMSKAQNKIKKIVDKGSQVRIVADDTDLTFSIKGRQGIKCDGHRNMPDGEVFVGPVETTAEGYIKYTYPAIRGGREVSGIRLEFKKGNVVKAEADKNENFLKTMLKIDPGAKRLGEFGIGLNFGIKQFIKQILFDEKIGGTIHLALGMAYKEGGGRNNSAIHWDMIKDLRKGGKFYIDNKMIQKNGKFLI